MAKKTSSRKKSMSKKFAPFGLLFSGLAFLVGIIFLAIKLLVLMQIYVPPSEKWINTALLICLGIFIIGFALYALLDPKRVREFLTGRQARHGSNALIMLIALIGILLVVNLIVYQNQKPWDWTEDKQHTLAPETLDTLKALPSQVTALGFFTQNYSSASAEAILTDFRDYSDGLFDYQIIDPESNPALAQQYEVTRNGTIVLILEDRQEMLSYASEQEITSALVRLMNPGQRVVYFLTGHGEASILNSGDTSYTHAVSALEAKNYTVLPLNLRAENEIPADALAIVIAGPTKPISASEVSLLMSYVNSGGSLLVLEQCTLETELGDTSDALQNYIAETWGVVFNNDIIIDSSSDQLLFAISYSYGDHAITTNLQNTITFFPVARSISLISSSADIEQSPLILTTDRAWGETDFQALANNLYEYQAGSDIPGPILLGAALTNTTNSGKLVVYGDSSFATDLFYDQYGNADLFINSIDWAAGEQSMISLTPKATADRSLNPIQNFGWIMLGLSFICIIPGIVIAGGVISWIARRARG
jgi:ABC-type uncharacterized transport system involved in gliding motility auxiliary subunit